MDSIYTSGDHLKGGGLLGGVSTLQETGLTGPISIYKLVPKVGCPRKDLGHYLPFDFRSWQTRLSLADFPF